MIRLLSLTAALALAPLSSALAHDPATATEAAAEARMEAASNAFEARMEAFGKRAEAISEDESLSESVRGQRIAALWSEYAPDVAAFTAETTKHATEMAAEALKDIDVNALVNAALNDPEVKQAMQDGMQQGAVTAEGIARNSAWTNPDPQQIETYGLIAQYALDQAADVVVEEGVEVPAAPAPPQAPEAPERPTA
jgi:enamine deaminase RidA (YjgF/YER057c/UK114 family)